MKGEFMFKPSVNSIKKSGKVVAEPPDYPEMGNKKSQMHGNPSRKSTLSIKKPK
jgi:hypothetical protein